MQETIDSGRKNTTLPFVRRKLVSTRAVNHTLKWQFCGAFCCIPYYSWISHLLEKYIGFQKLEKSLFLPLTFAHKSWINKHRNMKFETKYFFIKLSIEFYIILVSEIIWKWLIINFLLKIHFWEREKFELF